MNELEYKAAGANTLTQMQEVNLMDSMHKQKPVRIGGTSSADHTWPIIYEV